MTLKKSDLAGRLSERGFSRKRSAGLVERVLEIIKSTLERGEGILISGFGKFEVKEKGARKGRNPATGNNIEIDARRLVVFRPSPRLKDRMNGRDAEGRGDGPEARSRTVPKVVYVCDVCGEKHCICHRDS